MSNPFQASLEQLRSDRESMTWRERLQLARRLKTAIAATPPSELDLELLDFLAGDPKWEVRLVVVQTLEHVPDFSYANLISRFSQENNANVKSAVDRVIKRKRSLSAAKAQRREAALRLRDQIRLLEGEFGAPLAKKALHLSERHTEVIVGSIVHNLRSILTHLITNCESLVQHCDSGDESSARAVKKVRGDLEFLEKTVLEMDTYSRAMVPDWRREHLREVVQTALDRAQASLKRDGMDASLVQGRVTIDESLVVEMDRHQIVSALGNLIKNAYEALIDTPGKLRAGKVQIRAVKAKDLVTISIRDDGQGLTAKERDEIMLFIPARRSKYKRNSTGFGLPYVNKVVQAHHGTLELQSEEGKGTTIIITLPVKAPKHADETQGAGR